MKGASAVKRAKTTIDRGSIAVAGGSWPGRLLLAMLFLGVLLQLHAQQSVQVQVVDSATAEPLIGAAISVEGTAIGASADLNGRAELAGVPDGRHTLRVVMIGYRPAEVPVTVPCTEGVLRVRLAALSQQLEQVVVSATRTNSRIEDAPQKIEVLGAEELQEESNLKPGNIASLIGDISSVQMQQVSAPSGATVVRMQGLDGRHTLLLRDGMPAYGGLSGGFDLLRIPPLDLQRVELLKGPSSTFNGGGAIAGAINFVSKDPADSIGGDVLLNRTSLGGTDLNVYASGPLGRAGFTLFAGNSLQDAVDVDHDGWSDLPRTSTTVLHPQLFLKPGPRSHLRIGGQYQHDERTGGSMGALDAPADTSRYFLRTTGERKGMDLLFDSDLGKGSEIYVKGAWSGYDQQDRTNLTSTQHMQGNSYAEAYWSNASARRTWVVGGSFRGSQLKSEGHITQGLFTPGGFAQLALHRGRWPEIDLGVRMDMPAGYRPIVLPSVAAMYKLLPRFTLRANAGTGYQLPDLSQNYGLVGINERASSILPGTTMEHSVGGTAEWTWKLPLDPRTFLFVDQTFFLTAIQDPLSVVPGTGGASALCNTGPSAISRGVDNYVRVRHEPFDLYLGYTWTLPELTGQGSSQIMPYTPMHRAAATLGTEFGAHWRAGIEAAWSGQQRRFDGTWTREQLFMAAMVGYHSGRWTVALNGENITDVRQTRGERIVSGVPSRPVFAPLWAPIDGRVLNLSVLFHWGR